MTSKKPWTILERCPEWPLVGGLNNSGNWCGAMIEYFAEAEDGEPTHIHFYYTEEKVREMWPELAPHINVNQFTTVSFKEVMK